MIIANVVGSVWATKKDEGLNGLKLVIVEPIDVRTGKGKDHLVAVDMIGAGIGEKVLVTYGSSARLAAKKNSDGAIDAAIVGIIDDLDI